MGVYVGVPRIPTLVSALNVHVSVVRLCHCVCALASSC